MSGPLVSIVIPCHNASRWLPAALDSALAQTWPRCEIVVVDDGSTDDSLRVARAYESRGVRVATQTNRGASAARNHGLTLTRGELVQFLDADDKLAPEKIARQADRLASGPADRLASGEWALWREEAGEPAWIPQPTWRDLEGIEFQALHFNDGWMMPPIAWLCPRALLDAAGPWREDLTLNDDGEYFCRVMLRASGIVFVPGSRAYYRASVPGSLSRRRDRAALGSLLRSIEATTSALRAREDSARVRQACANAWQMTAYDLYPQLRAEARAAERRAKALGGSPHRLQGNATVCWAARLLGWRAGALVKHFQG